MLFSSTVGFYQGSRTKIRKKLPEETVTNASIDRSYFGWPSANSAQLLREQPHSLNINHFVLQVFLPEGHQERRGKVLTLHLECLVGFEQRTFWFDCNTLTH